MYQLPAILAGVSVAWILSANAAQAECRQEVFSCESSCPGLGLEADADGAESCTQRCRSIIICEPDRAPSSRLPKSALPSGRLPKSRLPASQLPDSFLN